jgi:hypothetical protein
LKFKFGTKIIAPIVLLRISHNSIEFLNLQRRKKMPAKAAAKATQDDTMQRATTLHANLRGKEETKLRPVPRTSLGNKNSKF